MIYKKFFCLIDFQLFHMSASFDLNFLAKSHTKYFQNGLKLLHLSQPSTWGIFRWWSWKLNQMSPPDRSEKRFIEISFSFIYKSKNTLVIQSMYSDFQILILQTWININNDTSFEAPQKWQHATLVDTRGYVFYLPSG